MKIYKHTMGMKHTLGQKNAIDEATKPLSTQLLSNSLGHFCNYFAV